jgi:hypothetical protein
MMKLTGAGSKSAPSRLPDQNMLVSVTRTDRGAPGVMLLSLWAVPQ